MDEDVGRGARVAIIGAGISGITLGLALKRKGFHDFVIYERLDEVGGCRSDIGAVLYSHSRHPNPDWTETHPVRAELLEYWIKVTDQNGIRPHLRMGYSFIKATWNPASKSYEMMFKGPRGEYSVSHNILVQAIGGFSVPKVPDVPGLDEYKGQVFHTTDWPVDLTVDKLRGKHVLVVGNGCSGIQITTALAKDPEVKVTLLANSHQWFAPSPTTKDPHSRPYSVLQRLNHKVRILLWLERVGRYVGNEINFVVFSSKGGMLRTVIAKKITRWMKKAVPEDLKGVIIPDFPYGAKRIIFDGGYFRALNQPSVTAVWDKLASATPESVISSGGNKFSPDILVLATGFDCTKGLDIIGRDGKITDADRSHTECYQGITLPGFPNVFLMMGMNASPAHTSVVFYLETQAHYITECILGMQKSRVEVLEVKKTASEKYNAWLDAELDKCVWATTKHHYRGDGGQGRVFTHFPGPATLFWWINAWVVWDDYIGGEAMAQADAQSRKKWIAIGVAMIVTASIWSYLHHSSLL